jgi:hypothetical protein
MTNYKICKYSTIYIYTNLKNTIKNTNNTLYSKKFVKYKKGEGNHVTHHEGTDGRVRYDS